MIWFWCYFCRACVRLWSYQRLRRWFHRLITKNHLISTISHRTQEHHLLGLTRRRSNQRPRSAPVHHPDSPSPYPIISTPSSHGTSPWRATRQHPKSDPPPVPPHWARPWSRHSTPGLSPSHRRPPEHHVGTSAWGRACSRLHPYRSVAKPSSRSKSTTQGHRDPLSSNRRRCFSDGIATSAPSRKSPVNRSCRFLNSIVGRTTRWFTGQWCGPH